MENKEKNNKNTIIIILLCVIIALLAGLLILFATGTIAFKDKNGTSTGDSKKVVPVNKRTTTVVVDKIIEDDEFFKSYVGDLLPSKTGSLFLNNIDEFNNEQITNFLFYHCIKEAVAKGLTDEMPAEGEYTFKISKEEIDTLVNKYFDVNTFDVVEGTGRDGIRKLDDNNYEAFWFAASFDYEDRFVSIEKNDDNKEVVVTYSVELKSEGTKGEVKYHLVKNANNWKLHCVEYLKK